MGFEVQKFLTNLIYSAKPPRCACGFKYFLVAALKARTDMISKASTDVLLGGGRGGGCGQEEEVNTVAS